MLKPELVAVAALGSLAMPANANGDIVKGERTFNKCKACHAVGDDPKDKLGPVPNGIVGAPVAQNPDDRYSDALFEIATQGLVWEEKTLGAIRRNPSEVVRGTKTSFAGLRKDDEVAKVIAYLDTH